jgi:hypothetical protein
MNAIQIKLPPRFIEDCLECDCDVGDYVFRSGILTATAAQLAELRSRADHYANGGLDAAPLGIIKSAKATLAALDRECDALRHQIDSANANAAHYRQRLSILEGELT